jgi:hypothetical protein
MELTTYIGGALRLSMSANLKFWSESASEKQNGRTLRGELPLNAKPASVKSGEHASAPCSEFGQGTSGMGMYALLGAFRVRAIEFFAAGLFGSRSFRSAIDSNTRYPVRRRHRAPCGDRCARRAPCKRAATFASGGFGCVPFSQKKADSTEVAVRCSVILRNPLRQAAIRSLRARRAADLSMDRLGPRSSANIFLNARGGWKASINPRLV